MSNELKPCPFCGGKDLKKEVIDGIEGMIYRVSCPHCANTMPMTVDTSMEEAIRIWNTRPVEDEMYRVLDKCQSCIQHFLAGRWDDMVEGETENLLLEIEKVLKKARGQTEGENK